MRPRQAATDGRVSGRAVKYHRATVRPKAVSHLVIIYELIELKIKPLIAYTRGCSAQKIFNNAVLKQADVLPSRSKE